MAQSQRREYLIGYLLQERPEYAGLLIPMGEEEQRRLLRSLMNLRPPAPISGEFLRVQDDYLRERLEDYRAVLRLPMVTGRDLIAAGIPPGPHMSALLARARALHFADLPRKAVLDTLLREYRTAAPEP